MKNLLSLLFCLLLSATYAQDSSQHHVQFTGYTEIYYQIDANRPAGRNRPAFIYSHNRHHETNLNLAFLKAAYSDNKARASLAIGFGTYMNANYSAEPAYLQNLLEASAGIRLSADKELWLDAGILPSHIGFESAVSKDCPTLTRSLLADNSPYFESGVRLSYTSKSEKWYTALLLLNGWQRIAAGNLQRGVSAGSQIQYKEKGRLLLNYSNYFGAGQADSPYLFRTFHNLYASISAEKNWQFILAADIGTQEFKGGEKGTAGWFSLAGIIQYRFCPQWALACRAEYYKDRTGIIIPVETTGGFRVRGFSLNLDFSPKSSVLLRLEIKNLHSPSAIFEKENDFVRSNTSICSSMAVSF